MTRCWCDVQQKQHMLSVLSKNSQRERYLHRYPIGNFIWRDIRSCSCNRSCNCKPPYNLKYKRIHRAYAGRLTPPANPPVPHGGHTHTKKRRTKERRRTTEKRRRNDGETTENDGVTRVCGGRRNPPVSRQRERAFSYLPYFQQKGRCERLRTWGGVVSYTMERPGAHRAIWGRLRAIAEAACLTAGGSSRSLCASGRRGAPRR